MIPMHCDIYWTNPATGAIEEAPYLGDDFPLGEDGGVYGVPLMTPDIRTRTPSSSDYGIQDAGMSCLWIG